MYRLNTKTNELEEINEINYKDVGLKERDHIEEWIRKNPELLGDELLIIAHEYDKFDTNDRLDLLAIDKEGALVIIELKRDQTGSSVDFQSLKYCSYCSQLSAQDIIEIYGDYLKKFKIDESPIDRIANHLELDINNEDKINEIINNTQKFIIAGKDIDRKILSVCAWLSENGIDCKCFTIKPFKNDNDQDIFIDVNQIIPPYKINDYYIGTKERKTNPSTIYQANDVITFFENILNYVKENSNLKINYSPRKAYCNITFGSNVRFTLRYFKRDKDFSIHSTVTDAKLKQKMETFFNDHKDEIKKLLENEILYKPEGDRNPDWSRIVSIFPIDENKQLNDYVNEIGKKFIIFSQYIIKNW